MKLADGKPLNLIILGDVGAGKATQSAYFAKKYKLRDFDMGLELTLLRQKNARVDLAQKKTADKGILTPTKIVRGILERTIKQTKPDKGILFDGHPKMIGEAKIVKTLLDQTKRSKPLVIYLSIPQSESIARVKQRKGYQNTSFLKRSDDTLRGLKNRARYYRDQISRVVDYFAKHYQFVTISGTGTRSQVQSRIQAAINAYIKDYAKVHQKTRRN